jgi:imidazolonepropionase-like amidohydrolase
MDAYEALKAITLYPAEILKIDHQVGSITPGKSADLVVWDRHPLDIQANTTKIFIQGELVKE